MQTQNCISGIQHIGIPVKDMDATMDFYRTLGFEQAFACLNNGNKVSFMRQKNLVLELYEDAGATGRPGAIDHVALDVTDIEKAFARAQELHLHLLDKTIQALPFWANGVKFFTVLGPNEEKVEFSQML